MVIEPGPGLTRRELASRAAYLERAAIGEARRAARAFMLSLARRAAVELARLVHWRSAEAEAVEALPVPVPAGRGPPARCSATKDPCESANRNRNQTIATRKGKPNMTPIREKAPKRFPVRDFLKIVCPIHKTLAASLMRIAPAGAVVRSAVVFTSCAAGPDSTGGRYVVLAD